MELQKDITKQALQIQTVGQFVKLTKGQSALLKAIRRCVENQKSITWDVLVDIFYDNVSKEGRDWQAKWALDLSGYSKKWTVYDIKTEYAKGSSVWQYHIKPRIRQWFVSTIGILVVKNQLIVIPTIEME